MIMEGAMNNLSIRFISLAALVLLVVFGAEASAQEFTFPVRHDHAVKSCEGDLIINQTGVEYCTSSGHARKWTYTDIKMIELISDHEIRVLTYDARRIKLGHDQEFKFKVLNGEIPKAVSEFLLARVDRPLTTSFVASKETPLYELPVRHRHRLTGCQGSLRIYPDRITYESENPEHSRYWRWQDIQSISRAGPYQFTITTYEPQAGGPTRSFNFDLKERMNDDIYEFLWAKVYRPAVPVQIKGEGVRHVL
jgi:hypothetical protein